MDSQRIKRVIYLSSILIFFNLDHVLAEEKESAKDKEQDFEARVLEEVKKRLHEVKKKSVIELSKELLDREKELLERERKIKDREERVKVTEESLKQRIIEFNKRQKKIIGCLEDNKKKHQTRVKQLVNVVSNMKPDKAADLLSVQDNEISVQILSQLEPERASKIFNLMDKEISARLQKAYLTMEK
jgi:flagellar motility protein MotE (MotC chaperone)